MENEKERIQRLFKQILTQIEIYEAAIKDPNISEEQRAQCQKIYDELKIHKIRAEKVLSEMEKK